MRLFFSVLSILSLLSGTSCVTKTWSPNTFLEKDTNWSPMRRQACNQDVLVSPKYAIASLSSALSFKKIVLPMSGEIILNEGALLSPVDGDKCQGKEYEFVSVKKHHWWKPSNWISDSPIMLWGGDLPHVAMPRIIPDSDQPPCTFDDVIFPNGSAFRLVLEGDPTVKSLTMNGQKMDSVSFQSFALSTEGRRMVEGNGHLRVDESLDCTDPTGCVCTNAEEQANYMRICEAVGACESTNCSDPIMPDGFCCPICCSLVDFEYSDGFKLNSLKEKLMNILKEFPVVCFMSKRMSGKIQAICMDSDGQRTTHSVSFVEKASQQVLADETLHVKLVKSLHSVKWLSDQSSNTASDVGLILGLLFLFLLLGAVMAVSIYVYRKKRLPNFNFVRFDRGVTKVEVELGTTPHDDLQPQDISSKSSARNVFYNPVYAKEQSSQIERMPDKKENPLYGHEEVVDG